MPTIPQSDRVRQIVRSEFVEKARMSGRSRFSICARDVLKKAEESPDFPRARTPLICNVLQSQKLLRENSLEIESIEGPPSRQSRTVVVHYRLRDLVPAAPIVSLAPALPVSVEDADAWAERVTSKILGMMKSEIAAHGGAEGYLRWVRGEDDEVAQ